MAVVKKGIKTVKIDPRNGDLGKSFRIFWDTLDWDKFGLRILGSGDYCVFSFVTNDFWGPYRKNEKVYGFPDCKFVPAIANFAVPKDVSLEQFVGALITDEVLMLPDVTEKWYPHLAEFLNMVPEEEFLKQLITVLDEVPADTITIPLINSTTGKDTGVKFNVLVHKLWDVYFIRLDSVKYRSNEFRIVFDNLKKVFVGDLLVVFTKDETRIDSAIYQLIYRLFARYVDEFTDWAVVRHFINGRHLLKLLVWDFEMTDDLKILNEEGNLLVEMY
jgi:hypothetical protein